MGYGVSDADASPAEGEPYPEPVRRMRFRTLSIFTAFSRGPGSYSRPSPGDQRRLQRSGAHPASAAGRAADRSRRGLEPFSVRTGAKPSGWPTEDNQSP